jgi:sec-independent protein translocase protein TatA
VVTTVFPLQIPGGPELVVLILVLLFLFGIPLVLVALGVFGYLSGDDERVAELEARVAELEAELDANGSGEETSAGSDGSAGDDSRKA